MRPLLRLFPFLLAAGVSFCTLANAATPTVPLSAFVQEDQFSKPRLSPDGKHIAVTARMPSGGRFVPVLIFYSLPEIKQVGAVRMPIYQVPVEYFWVSNTRLIVEKGIEPGSRDAPESTGEWLATDLDGTRQAYLFGREMFRSGRRTGLYADDHAWGDFQGLPRELNGHFYLAEHGWNGTHSLLYDIDSMTGSRKLLADVPAKSLNFLIQNDNTPRFAYGVGEDSYALLYRYNDATSGWDRVNDRSSRRYSPQNFLPDDKSIVVEYSPDGGPDQLIEENLASGERKVLFSDSTASVDTLEYGATRKLPFGARDSTGSARVRYFEGYNRDAELHQKLSASFPGNKVHFIDFTEDGNTLLFSTSSDRDPGSFFLYQRSTGKADLLFSAMAAIDPDAMRAKTPISFKSRDGVILHGFLTLPKGTPGVKPPMVIMAHGGPHGVHDVWHFDTDAQFLASRGYAVLQVNYRGSGGRGVNFQAAGYRQWGARIQDDLMDGIAWAIAEGKVDGTRVCSYGASFGAYSALMLAARDPSLIKCAVGYAGVYDLNLIIDGDTARSDRTSASFYKRYLGNDRAELNRFSPAKLADRITSPVLLVHGGEDKRAPPEHAEAMRAALIKVNRPPEWLYASTEGHGFYDTANVTKFYQSLEAFLDKHIGH